MLLQFFYAISKMENMVRVLSLLLLGFAYIKELEMLMLSLLERIGENITNFSSKILLLFSHKLNAYILFKQYP